MNIRVVDHPVVQHKLGLLREKEISTNRFREVSKELASLLMYEATKDLVLEKIEVDSWCGPTEVGRIKGKKLTVVPILRAGIGMLDGVLSLMPSAKISVVGLSRNEATLQPEPYFEKLVGNLDERIAIIIDPMLATGGSMVATIDMLKRKGCKDIRALVIVAAPEGVALVNKTHPDVSIIAASLDSHLNEHGYIIPGLGDAGDKIFGTILK